MASNSLQGDQSKVSTALPELFTTASDPGKVSEVYKTVQVIFS